MGVRALKRRVLLAISALAFMPAHVYACSIQFTSPARGSTVSTSTVSVSGTASGFATTGSLGNAVATANGTTFFSYSGMFTSTMNFGGNGSAVAPLQPGPNVLKVTGSVNGCSASDTMVIYYTPPPPVAQKNGGEPKDPNCTNPVNGATGNKFQAETDFVGSGRFPLEFKRYYNSAYTEARTLGKGWRHSYDRQLSSSSSIVYIVRPDANAFRFNNVGGNWVADGDINDKLSQVTINGVTKWQLVRGDDNTTEYYEINGRLSSVVSQTGRTQSLGYDTSGRLSSITDQYTGQKLQLAYDASHRLSTLTDPDGKVYTYQYSDNVHLTSVTYPALSGSPQRQYLYNEPAFTSGANLQDALTGIVDENTDRYASYTYDAQGRGIVTEHANGQQRYSLSYNADGTTTVTDPLGAARTYGYQTLFNVTRKNSQNQPPGAGCSASSSSLTYDANGNIATRTDFNGSQTQYTWDLTRNLETKRVEGLTSAGVATTVTRTISTQWHPDWRLATRIAEPLKITTLVYNGQPDPTNANAVTSCAPATALINGKPIAVLCKRVEQATTDASGTLAFAATAASGTASTRIWQYTYNSDGQPLTMDGPRTDVADSTTYTYYPATETDPGRRGNLASTTDALGHVWQYTAYDANGRILSVTDPNNTVTSYTYDPRGRLKSRSINGNTTLLDYDPVGQLKTVTLPDASTLDYTYDAAHRLTDITDANGHVVHYTLDAAGNRTREEYRNADGTLAREVNRSFDALGRLQSDIQGDLSQLPANYGYYANGEPKTAATPKGDTTSLDIDPLGRAIRRIDPVNGSTQPTLIGYDGQDRLTTYTAPNGAAISHTYDGLGNLQQQVSADSGNTSATYDAAGNLKTRTDARGLTLTYQYDALNRLTRIDTPATGGIPASALLYTWDTVAGCTHGIGRLCQVTDEAGSTLYDYDANGNRISETRTEGGQSFTTRQAFNAADRPTDLIPPTAETVSVILNPAGQVQDIRATGSNGITTDLALNIGYAATGRIYSQRLGLLLLNADFDSAGRVTGETGTSQTNSGDAPLPAWALAMLGAGLLGGMMRRRASGGVTALMSAMLLGVALSGLPEPGQAADLSLQYDANGNVSSKTTPSGSTAYTYDALDRLDTESGPAGSRNHDFDGNDNRLTDGAGTTATFTPNSDRLATINGVAVTLDAAGNVTADGAYRYVWDAQNQLRELRTPGNALIASYFYDHRQLRSRKVTTAVAPQGVSTTFYHYDQQGRLIGESASSSVPLRTYVWNGDTLTGLIIHQPQRVVYTVQVDHLGSPFQVRSLEGKVLWRWESEAFGNTPPNEDVDGDSKKLSLNLRFPGQYFDQESGLHYNWHRYYSPVLARYLSPDPIGLKGGGNEFAYVGGMPTSRTDPFGLQDKWYGYTDSNFRDWAHAEKQSMGIPGNQNFTKEQLDDLAKQWDAEGRPRGKGGKSGKGGQSRGGGGGMRCLGVAGVLSTIIGEVADYVECERDPCKCKENCI